MRRTLPPPFGRLPTEQRNPASRGIDARPAAAIVALLDRENGRVPRAVAAEAVRLTRGVGLIVARLRAGGGLLFVGAGTSGRLGVLEAAECPPTFGVPRSLVSAAMAGGRSSVFRAKEGAEDDAGAGAAAVRRWAARRPMRLTPSPRRRRTGPLPRRRRVPGVVIGIAASGVTPFVRGALGAARGAGCRTILVTSNALSPIREAEVVIAPRVGPELVAGSTRLKAASAAKMVLNTLTTAAMILLGKVHDGWMVDLKPTNRKLRDRALRMVASLGGTAPDEAERLFAQSGGRVKTAVLMARTGLGRAQALRRLRECGGSLRDALGGRESS
ncbi:MAG: hypothetical protein A2X36_15940 [Elusimicrobia bacterium GWA2_69_24]|nr:MAG: hypothetical protein A2X36_15940 [Elusimicrobia bacterium GWA2_69_24]HBL16595.1 N-acetylmuramic acid 6-phosphate etherase [Elusimicrobiota bacterium]